MNERLLLQTTPKKKLEMKHSVFSLNKLSPKEIKRRFGFNDLFHSLIFVAVTCAGNMEIIVKTNKSLTWIEEWLMYLEFVCGHSLKIWNGIESKTGFDVRCLTFRETIDTKLDLVLKCRNHWPMRTPTYEDMKFRKEIWNLNFSPKKR